MRGTATKLWPIRKDKANGDDDDEDDTTTTNISVLRYTIHYTREKEAIRRRSKPHVACEICMRRKDWY
jgi:hypothetical protein